MKTSASIRFKSVGVQIVFEWLDFDGDDCFDDFHIDVVTQTDNRRFDFGGCAVNGLRKVRRFLQDDTQTTVGGGFRNPDVCYFDLDRKNGGFSLVVRFEGKGISDKFNIQNPQIEIDDDFMKTVYPGPGQ